MRSRRAFLSTVAGAAAGALVPARLAGLAPRRVDHDLVIRGGLLLDGTGAPASAADLAITGDRITAIGPRLADRARDVWDARGLVVSPGFVDIHSHADGTLFADPRLESAVRQGITTVVVGQDGGSRFPRGSAGDADAGEYERLADFRRAVDALRPGTNVASMIGLGTVRAMVVGADDRPATPAEIARMRALVAQAADDGAVGVSTGLEYTPGAFASLAELVEVTRGAAGRGICYSTHLRNEDDHLLEALDEAIAVALGARVPLQVAHLKAQGPRNWGKLDEAFAKLLDARDEGELDVAFDVYPYVAYQTTLTNLFPLWSKDGGTPAFLRRLADPALADRLRRETQEKADLIGGWGNVQLASVPRPADRRFEGMRADAAARLAAASDAAGAAATPGGAGDDPFAFAVALLRRNEGAVGMIGFAMSEDNVARELAHPMAMVCSDGGAFATEGPARRGRPHPRGLGAFARVLGVYVRERQALTLADAVRKMTSVPAARCRLRDRGVLRVGAFADVTLFDADRVIDRATFAEPFAYAEGIEGVVVNGAVTLRDGQRVATGGRGVGGARVAP